jgi:gamma-glutamylcyclotransferase (GGCT)/AIG2-like uncharacterized protein YtfP
LLARYVGSDAYTDCYSLAIRASVSLARYAEAFYTSRVFGLERWILEWLAGKPSTDAEAKLLAEGRSTGFAAWTVEDRSADQLLLCDYLGRTRSWLMTEPIEEAGEATRLYFGSAVLKPGRFPFNALLGFHQAYSRILLSSAARRLANSTGERLFSYGSLRSERVQLATFGRLLDGREDELASFELRAPIPGVTPHANVVRVGDAAARVPGTVFIVTESELAAADEYERRDGYVRIAVRLASGSEAWVYVDRRSIPGRTDDGT